MSAKGELRVKSLKKAIDVLNCFTVRQPLGVTEISEMLGLYKSNVHDILSTLLAMDYLTQDAVSSKYYLGPAIVRLNKCIAGRYGFPQVAGEHIRAISGETGELVYLTALLGEQVYYLDTAVPGDHPRMASNAANGTDPLYCTSSGKAMLAYMPEEFIAGYLATPLAKLTDNTITDPSLLRAELANIRRLGYATDNMEFSLGISCVAVPIIASGGEVYGAVSISGPSLRFSKERTESFAALLKKHVREIERFL